MKKQLSVWMLCAGSTVKKLVLLLIALCAGSAGLWYLAVQKAAGQNMALSPEQLFSGGHLALWYFVIFLLWTSVLTAPSLSRARYTLDRLQVTPKNVFAVQLIYNALSYAVLWGAQVVLTVALFRWYGSTADPAAFGPQSIMLAFYRDYALHSLLPLADWTRYLRNIVILLAMAAAAAVTCRGLRRTQAHRIATFILEGVLLIWYPLGMGELGREAALAVFCVIYAGAMICSVYPDLDKEERYEEA